MTMYKGSNQLSSLNVGGTEIGQIYKGNQLVWEKAEPVNVELIQGTQTSGTIETTVILKANKSYVVEMVAPCRHFSRKNKLVIGAFLKDIITIGQKDIPVTLYYTADHIDYPEDLGIWGGMDLYYVDMPFSSQATSKIVRSFRVGSAIVGCENIYIKNTTTYVDYPSSLSQSLSYYDEYYGLTSPNLTFYGSPTSAAPTPEVNGYIHVYDA